jgi:hypothetical protein
MTPGLHYPNFTLINFAAALFSELKFNFLKSTPLHQDHAKRAIAATGVIPAARATSSTWAGS